MKESRFQKELIDDLKSRFQGCLVLKNDASYIQGIPDLMVLYKDKWAALECKTNSKAKFRPNQEHYLDILDNMSYAKVVYPKNKEEVLDELQQTFRA